MFIKHYPKKQNFNSKDVEILIADSILKKLHLKETKLKIKIEHFKTSKES